MVSRLDRVLRERRAALARRAAASVLEALEREGLHAVAIGSLAQDTFNLHSDLDFLVYGPCSWERRAAVERLVHRGLSGTGFQADIILAEDVSPDRLEEFDHATCAARDLRQRDAEAGSGSGGIQKP